MMIVIDCLMSALKIFVSISILEQIWLSGEMSLSREQK